MEKGKGIFVIEHLEPRMWPWCIIEYKSISKNVGKDKLWITNLPRGCKPLDNYSKIIKEQVKNLNLQNACVLDPEAPKTLSPEEAKSFDYFIFGGILGDDPPQKRTEIELTKFVKGAEVRNIGKEQFSTDNAVFVVHEILNGKKLEDMKFQDTIEIQINDVESTILPYRYPLINGKPRISDELVKFLKNKRGM